MIVNFKFYLVYNRVVQTLQAHERVFDKIQLQTVFLIIWKIGHLVHFGAPNTIAKQHTAPNHKMRMPKHPHFRNWHFILNSPIILYTAVCINITYPYSKRPALLLEILQYKL